MLIKIAVVDCFSYPNTSLISANGNIVRKAQIHEEISNTYQYPSGFTTPHTFFLVLKHPTSICRLPVDGNKYSLFFFSLGSGCMGVLTKGRTPSLASIIGPVLDKLPAEVQNIKTRENLGKCMSGNKAVSLYHT